MAKLEKVFLISLVTAMIGVVGFWVFGFKDNLDASGFSLAVSGVAAAVALGAKGLQKLRCPYL